MISLRAKLGAGVTIASLMLTVATPVALADTTVDVSGNGAGSANTVVVLGGGGGQNTTVEQKNELSVHAAVSASANTGGNNVSQNTTSGGDVTLETGKAEATATMSVTGGSNDATVTGCGCEPPATDVTVSGNGALSHNTVVVLTKKPKTKLKQKSKTRVGAYVGAAADSGNNKVKKNTTGEGSVDVTTDDATATSDLTVEAGTNTASL